MSETLPEGVTLLTLEEMEARPKMWGFWYFSGHTKPMDFPGTQEEYSSLNRELFAQLQLASQDWSCGRAVRNCRSGTHFYEPADARPKVNENWAEPKLKELGITFPPNVGIVMSQNLPEGTTLATPDEVEAFGSVDAINFFTRFVMPEEFKGTQDEYDAINREINAEVRKYRNDFSCGKVIQINVNGATIFEAADAEAKGNALALAKLKELGIELPA